MTDSSSPVARVGLFDLTLEALRDRLAAWKEPPYRAAQILEWVYRRNVTCFEDMTNLPKGLRTRLAADVPLYASTITQRQVSQDGTVKLLLRWADGATSECVLIPDGRRRTGCLSTQAGCPVGCAFCASGLEGLHRSLTVGEIVEQAMGLRDPGAPNEPLTNVVLMGLGEPLANYEATVAAVRTINAAWGLGIGARKITISTVGVPKMIRRLAHEGLQVTLALSLHAPTDELRQQLVPWARHIRMESLMEAATYYFEHTGREVTIEYVLLGGINDSVSHARQLAVVARRIRSNINLLTYNPVEGLPFRRPADADTRKFLHTLREKGINAHARPGRGADIDAACGQLRRRESSAVERNMETTGPSAGSRFDAPAAGSSPA